METSDRLGAGRFYTYLHRQADTGEIFYVGKGTKSRANAMSRRNAFWQRVAAKHGVHVELVAHWPTELEALLHEQLLVSVFRDSGCRLTNLTDGGGGMVGWKATPETIARMSAAQRAPDVVARKSAAISAAKSTPEARAKNSRISRERWQGSAKAKRLATIGSAEFRAAAADRAKPLWNNAEYRANHAAAMASPGVKERMRQSMSTPEYKATHRARMQRLAMERQKKVLCIETGMIFSSGKDAATAMHLQRSKISQVCNGKAAKTGGYTFRFLEDKQ